jgi:chaperonin GroEL (HSP60 family)
VGAEIVRRALPYSLKLIARNAGTNGSVVVQKVGGSCHSLVRWRSFVSNHVPLVPTSRETSYLRGVCQKQCSGGAARTEACL